MNAEAAACRGKKAWPSRGTAERARRKTLGVIDFIGKDRGGSLRVFRCPVCGLFHLGNANDDRYDETGPLRAKRKPRKPDPTTSDFEDEL